MNRQRLSAIIAGSILIAALLTVTNPSWSRHEEAIRTSFASLHPLYEPLGFSVGAMYAPDYWSVGAVSATTLDGKLTTLGALGRVWVYPHRFGEPVEPVPNVLSISPDEAILYD